MTGPAPRVYAGDGPDIGFLERFADLAAEAARDHEEAARAFADQLAGDPRLRLAAAYLAVMPAWNEKGGAK